MTKYISADNAVVADPAERDVTTDEDRANGVRRTLHLSGLTTTSKAEAAEEATDGGVDDGPAPGGEGDRQDEATPDGGGVARAGEK